MFENFLYQDEVIVCLYDKEYHYGLAALVNSLVKSEFKGIIYVAYKGFLPPWIIQLKSIGNDSYYLTEDIIIQFECIKTDMHLAYYKPYFIKQTFTRFPLAIKVFYFDVDIIVTAPWSFFSNWLQDEVCLCLDESYEFVHPNHPWRRDWKKFAKINGTLFNPVTFYVNSGFVGVNKKTVALIDKWIQLIEFYRKEVGSLMEIDQSGHNSYKGDQDFLNAAITISPEIELSVIGKEGMGFTYSAYLMTHAIDKIKPWKKHYVGFLLKTGRKPDLPEKNYFNNCQFLVSPFSKFDFFMKRSDLLIASFLGRFIGY